MALTSPNNPAGRLLRIVERMQQHSKHGKIARDAWPAVLEISGSDMPRLFRSLADVVGLTHSVRRAAQSLQGIDAQHLTAWIPKFLEPWNRFNIAANFDHFTQPIDETMIAMLHICDDMMGRQHPEPIVLEEQLRAIQQDVAGVAKQIADSELDPQMKDYLLYYLEIIEAAVQDYRLKGFSALRAGFEHCVGAFAVNSERREEMESTPEGTSVLRILGAYALIVTSVLATVQLPNEIKKYLPDKTSKPVAELQTRH
jgi:hypothetical protein